jgi:hypothetical protein
MPGDNFQIIGSLENIQIVAIKHSIRDYRFWSAPMDKVVGVKLKGTATVQLENGRIRLAEIHWYEAHGIGKRQMKIKRYLD